MTVLVTGSTGLVGSSLVPHLEAGGHRVLRLVRASPKNDVERRWDPETGELAPAALEGIQAVVHLAGENIASGRWNEAKKSRIRSSREDGTQLLAQAIAESQTPPGVLISASAVGYYGNRGDEILNEESPPGADYLAETCIAWENAARPAADAGVRTVTLRIGIVLSADGGALAKMLFPFKMGVGGVIGSGAQVMSWVSLSDLLGIIVHALNTESLEGPVNAVSPAPATNREFTKTLGSVLSRPTLFPMPAFAARLAFGEMADALLLSGARVTPARLQESGYDFQHPELEGALRHVLDR
ncbi:MAG: TIGR01777 family oxidoreductase [Gemmatimonadota bacterium]|nr:TIGR01777 family oxidoreductase [Gemmatimonadota bacterium]